MQCCCHILAVSHVDPSRAELLVVLHVSARSVGVAIGMGEDGMLGLQRHPFFSGMPQIAGCPE